MKKPTHFPVIPAKAGIHPGEERLRDSLVRMRVVMPVVAVVVSAVLVAGMRWVVGV